MGNPRKCGKSSASDSGTNKSSASAGYRILATDVGTHIPDIEVSFEEEAVFEEGEEDASHASYEPIY